MSGGKLGAKIIAHSGAAGKAWDAIQSAGGTVKGTLQAKFDEVMSGLKKACRTAALKSFSGETQVLLADGTGVAIEDLQPGDQVLATDPFSGESAARTISATWVHEDTLFDLDVGGAPLTTTEDHPFWNASERQWQQAQDLDPHDELSTPIGRKTVAVGSGLDRASSRMGMAYNVTVADTHTYYVAAGQFWVLVHNVGCGGLVKYGSDDLSQMAYEYRMKNGIDPNQNVAIFEYSTPSGPGYVTAPNIPRGLHSEQRIDNYLQSIGIDPKSVSRIYSERVPCSTAGHACAGIVGGYRNATVSWSLEGDSYGNYLALSDAMAYGIR